MIRASVVGAPSTDTSNRYYATNQAPLKPSPLVKLPLGSIRPAGWLKQQIDLMVTGMAGRLGEVSTFLGTDSSWRSADGRNGAEEAPYWLRGFHDLAVLSGDEGLQAEANRWIEAVLASQRDDGYFGPSDLTPAETEFGTKFSGVWVHALMIDPLITHYEHSGDPRVIPFLARFMAYCRDLSDETFIADGHTLDRRRPGEMITHVHWLYNQTREPWLLDLAARFFRRLPHTTDAWPGRDAMLRAGANDVPRRYRTDEWLVHHVVDFTHRMRYPGSYYPQSKAAWHLAASEYWYRQHLDTWGQPRGIFGADEVIRSTYTDPRQGCETCAMVEFAKDFYILGRITGNPVYADRCEDVMLNHFPAAQTSDLKGLHYLTASNQPQLDASVGHDYANGGRPMVRYSPFDYRCCQHNVGFGWPWYVENLWQGTADNGLAAWLYAASTVTARVGPSGDAVSILTETDYPFSGLAQMTINARQPSPFPLYLRVPRWCTGLQVSVNGEHIEVAPAPGTYVRIERTWTDGDVVTVQMPMRVAITEWPRNGSVTVDRGPLSYSVRIEEEWRRCGGTDEWPEWEVLPTSPWNYGLVIDRDEPAGAIEIVETGTSASQPWTLEGTPLELRVKARRIPGWVLEPSQTVQELRPSPIRSSAPEETIRMVPLGCARLRMSCLPTIGDGLDAREWK